MAAGPQAAHSRSIGSSCSPKNVTSQESQRAGSALATIARLARSRLLTRGALAMTGRLLAAVEHDRAQPSQVISHEQSGLVVRLDAPLPRESCVGLGTALFVCGTCFHGEQRIRGLSVVV